MSVRCERIWFGISPGVGVSKPRAIARMLVITKLIHRIWIGLSGAPMAMFNNVAPTKSEIKLTRELIWNRMYFIRLS